MRECYSCKSNSVVLLKKTIEQGQPHYFYTCEKCGGSFVEVIEIAKLIVKPIKN